MESTISLTIAVLLLLSTIPVQAIAGPDANYFYQSAGITKSKHTGSEDAWVTQYGYNYNLTSTIGFDLGYAQNSGHPDPMISLSSQFPHQPTLYYQEIFGGAVIQHTVFDVAWIYAKGGLSLTRAGSDPAMKTLLPDIEAKNISPYLTLGATIPSGIASGLELNFEISYQEQEQDAITSPVFLLGTHYRF
ncbi:hypothetical protein [Vibrio gazogenes]|uniref:Outer membrane protein beta-barrel domain-containing protein n=1 Tax=Vibrio gazogenes DSM 21264 = NBRC 103151 TaxID=1123492 RepID=A0A1M4T167_VIBGA|nr:hypothetical protein [Vibrio gazogenes]USP15995.1 porin family protein [Vibrio gazogenes]SHE38221.1 hypothetical protein SAMN02745781_00208 [Vibrio gazogenes DSM 21264] [Vibrio gazogenes DSM 21264 = NBRC 103151]SJN54709.1 hypothetical protein BQ6471_01162 [Vibrio gazogenes]